VHGSEREKKRGTKTTTGIPLRVLYHPRNWGSPLTNPVSMGIAGDASSEKPKQNSAWVPNLIRPPKNDTV
jgi:hypothetical protein